MLFSDTCLDKLFCKLNCSLFKVKTSSWLNGGFGKVNTGVFLFKNGVAAGV